MRILLVIVAALACLVHLPILRRNYRDWLRREKRNPVSVAIGLEILLHVAAAIFTLELFLRSDEGLRLGLTLNGFRLLLGLNYLDALRRGDKGFTSRAGDPLPPIPRPGDY